MMTMARKMGLHIESCCPRENKINKMAHSRFPRLDENDLSCF